MNITLNNRPESFDKNQITISELLKIKNFTFKMLVIKVNSELVKKDSYDNSLVKDGDNVTVLHLISGG
ncbi:MAG: sulfur carrier protein ThiS [Bacteroidales bacterium]|nr:sulfur carrier protein ThiS [Bacteroidales bacterium]